jgi:cytochrome c-type biogenesis protein CcmF
MEYVGEHLWIGRIGNLFIVLSFVFALLSCISYFFAAKQNEATASWKIIARAAFKLHGLSVFGIVGTLFIMLSNHYFEYEYVWHHSNTEMPMKYILSCFWEGQEGSFLLWTFWHVVLGLVLQRSAKNFESPVMAVISAVQVFLASMLLGIYIFDYKIGSNPFILIRDMPDNIGLPWTQLPDYLQKVPMFKDGRGLNPLLQNYWMTIHPPTLFLGFALTVVPFAYAIAGLWKKQFTEWIKPALTWTFFGIAILGVGILMGGAWAYEALSFGGFWAWDPVENASLVPWIVMAGAAHLMLIAKKNGQSIFLAFLFTILTFVLILYSTFLTRSGILGESSVHAFTDLGMSGQLLIYLLFFFALGIFLLIKNWKHFPKQTEEEGIWSREFWMFVGAIVLLVSAFQITFYTSLPVWNKLFNQKWAAAKDAVTFYNNWQLPFAFIVTMLIAIGQFLKYKNTDFTYFIKKISLSLIGALLLTILMAYILNYNNSYYLLLMFSSIFATLANIDYAVRVLKGKIAKSGASIAHIGFGLILLGALISTSKKEIISQNSSGKDVKSLGEQFSNNENIVLTQGDTLTMGRFYATYVGKRFEGINIYFDVDYFTKNEAGKYEKVFSLAPLLQTNPRMGNVAEPDTRHFLTYDVYTHVTFADLESLEEKKATADEYTTVKKHMIKKGDTIFSSNAIIVFDSLSIQLNKENEVVTEKELAVKANLSVNSIDKKYQAAPIYYFKDGRVQSKEALVDELGLRFMFWKINPETGEIEISLQEKKSNIKDFIVMQALVFPYINILWIGCIVMAIGTLIAVWQRAKNKS